MTLISGEKGKPRGGTLQGVDGSDVTYTVGLGTEIE